MGGNLVKDCERMSNEQFKKIAEGIVNEFKCSFNIARIEYIPSYAQKESHGDIDILIGDDHMLDGDKDFPEKGWQDFFAYLPRWMLGSTKFSFGDYFVNGNIVSFEVLCLEENLTIQVDFIFVKEKEFDFALSYFSYNDLGNLLGRIAHKLGFKFGWQGLSYVFRSKVNPDRILREVVITHDFDAALKVIGYNAQRWHEGFESLEDIFRYVASGMFFDKEIFLLHNRNSISRRRDAKRKTYMEFLKWCENIPQELDYPIIRFVMGDGAGKDFGLQRLFALIPETYLIFEAIEAQCEARDKVEAARHFYLNGERIMKKTGLKGKELGVFFARLREEFHPNDPIEFVNYDKHIDAVLRQITDESLQKC